MVEYFTDLYKEDSYNYKIQIWFLICDLFTFLILFKIEAYYGKFYKSFHLLPLIPSKISWIIQEMPSAVIPIIYLFLGFNNKSIKLCHILYLIPFTIHYIHRTLIFPFKIKSSRNNPLEVTMLAFSFCIFNSTMISRSTLYYMDLISNTNTVTYIIGLIIFVLGMSINIFHDYYLIKLRGKQKGYVMPKGYLYNYITCPNYFGEIMEWFGFFILNRSFSAFVFFVSTFSNLFPRAISYRKYYQEKFKEEFVNKDIKAIFPFII